MNSLRFLLVHRDARQAERIAAVLARANHTVLPTAGLEEAADALSVEQFDAVLLDLEFTRLGLAEFSSKLRRMADGRRPSSRIPIIAIDAGEFFGRAAEESVFDAVMPEPIDPYALTEAVSRLAQAVSGPSSEDAAANFALMPVLEPEKFDEQVGSDPELMVEIIDLFLEERRRQEPEMREALQNNELEMLSRLAHTIKGSLGSLHAEKARRRAQELETASKNGDEKASLSYLSALESDLAELEPELLSLRMQVAPV